MQFQDVLGWAAAALTLLAFSCNDLLRLRCSALAANGAFIAYGLTGGLWPVLALHFVLVPINVLRLVQTRQQRRRQGHSHLSARAVGSSPDLPIQVGPSPDSRSPGKRGQG